MTSYLTRAQRQALAATARGEVKRIHTGKRSKLECPTINSTTLWYLVKTYFIADGPREGDVATMVLTKKGERFLSPPNQDRAQLIAFWRWGGTAPKLSPAQWRALEATQHGAVTRTHNNKFSCPGLGARAIWSLLNAGLITDGPKNGECVQMILTPRGEEAIAATSNDH
jgi:hypothetical protein